MRSVDVSVRIAARMRMPMLLVLVLVLVLAMSVAVIGVPRRFGSARLLARGIAAMPGFQLQRDVLDVETLVS